MEVHRTFRIRNGDLDAGYMPARDRQATAIGATVLTNVLAALMFSTDGPRTDVCRFERVTGDGADKPPYIYGFHADHWVGMICAGFCQMYYRRNPEGKYRLDGGAGASGVLTGIARLTAENIRGVVDAESGQRVAQNALMQNNMAYLLAIQSLDELESTAEPGSNIDDLEQRLTKRLTNRLAYICAARGNVKNLTAKALSKGKGVKKGIANEYDSMPELPPLDELSLDIILEAVSKFHGKPEVYGPDKESIEAMTSLIAQRDGSMQSFVAAQESLADRLSALREDTQLVSGEEAKAEVRQCIEHSWVMGQMMSSTPPRKVDFREVLEAFNFSADQPARENLKLNPIGNPGFTAMPHQLVDAYIIWQLERSVLRGSLLANEVGTGKTITAIALMILDYNEICRKSDAGEPFEARPSLMVVPASLVGQTFSEVTKYFGGIIELKCCYGSPSEFKGLRAACTLTANQWDMEMEYSMNRKVIETKPKNALRLYLTSYPTAVSRWLTRETVHIRADGTFEGDECIYSRRHLEASGHDESRR
ncbi:hypothetical protein BJ170DRAFT_600523 [Xylariales sp. AK1849]|nr:hypothetical protein BJ170DRAFT_600523 [Xylariales sp. AK1849]